MAVHLALVLRYTDVSGGAVNAWIFGVVTVLVAVWSQSVRRPVRRPMAGSTRSTWVELRAGEPAPTRGGGW